MIIGYVISFHIIYYLFYFIYIYILCIFGVLRSCVLFTWLAAAGVYS